MGLILFLAGVGTRSGYAFVQRLTSGNGLAMLLGVMAGTQTQAATPGFALEQTGNEMPNLSYATVYPVAMVVKILLMQVILTILL